MRRIRVLVARLPRVVLCVLRRALALHGDFEVLAEVEDDDDIAQVARSWDADVVVMGLPETGAASPPAGFLDDRPHMKIVVLKLADRTATLLERRLRSVAMGNTSFEGFVAEIREAIRVERE